MNTSTPSAEEDSVRPIVPTGNSGKLGLIAFLIILGLGGIWIVSLMSEQRAALENQNAITATPDPNARISSPPPLVLPQSFGQDSMFAERGALPPVLLRQESAPGATSSTPTAPPRQSVGAPPVSALPSYVPPETFEPVRPLVTYGEPAQTPPAVLTQSGEADQARVSASRFQNPSQTVPQGTVIPAVLETALDSTRPGGVRALVQRNIHSFDGSRVLIQRGSRLYGEYDADLKPGENRALIRWTRLIRPDGVTIALDSPASDPLGRAGVKGNVDGKFFQRFGGALLQSVLDIGVGVATREATDGVIVALPGSTQNVTPRISEGEIRPTLKIRHGASVSVFVARDLDFSSVEP